jgi:hypothetical protein
VPSRLGGIQADFRALLQGQRLVSQSAVLRMAQPFGLHRTAESEMISFVIALRSWQFAIRSPWFAIRSSRLVASGESCDSRIRGSGFEDSGFKDSGFKDSGFKDSGFKDSGFKDSGFKD